MVKIPISGSNPSGPAAVLANSINGADGLLVDDHDNLWVVENQSDDIVVLDSTGKVIRKLGDFGGAIRRGSPVGLLFPASIRFSGRHLLVTNLSLDLRLFNPAFITNDSEWCAQVTRYTVVRIPLHRERH